VQRSGQWKRRFEASARYAAITGDTRPLYPPVMLEELTGKTVLLVGYGAIGKEIERMLAPFHVELLRVARSARTDPRGSCRQRAGQPVAASQDRGSDSALHA
jgi:phosphoglycerate dehydrogenase-like enzyme